MRRGSRAVIWVATLGVASGALGACGSSGPNATPTTTSSTSPVSPGSSTTIPEPVVEGRTKWVDVTDRWKALAPTPFDTNPDQVAEELAALWRGGDTSEVGIVEVVAVQRGEPAVIVIRERDVPDDSVAAVDYEITLQPGDEGWLVSKARAQRSCRRGVSATDATLCV